MVIYNPRNTRYVTPEIDAILAEAQAEGGWGICEHVRWTESHAGQEYIGGCSGLDPSCPRRGERVGIAVPRPHEI